MEEQSPETAKAIEQIQSLLVNFKSDFEAIRTEANELLGSLRAMVGECQTAATAIFAARTKINDDQAVIATKSDHIQNAQEHADKVRADLDRAQTLATQSATNAEAHEIRATTVADNASDLLTKIRESELSARTEKDQIKSFHESAKIDSERTRNLAERSDSIDKRLSEYEAAIADFRQQYAAQLETITGLLPGATAAGLAHAFDDRRKTFLEPAKRWQWIFVASVLSLVILAATGLYRVYQGHTVLGWDDLAKLWVARLPIAAALFWLALHAVREAALAKRLEEDYGYKAAIAASFLGFQQQMAKISETSLEGSPLSQLCDDTLATIGSPPGRIYDKQRLTVTPANAISEAVADATATKGASQRT